MVEQLQLAGAGGLFVWPLLTVYNITSDHEFLELTKSCRRSAKRERPGPRKRIASLGVYSGAYCIVNLLTDLSTNIAPKPMLPALGPGPLYLLCSLFKYILQIPN